MGNRTAETWYFQPPTFNPHPFPIPTPLGRPYNDPMAASEETPSPFVHVPWRPEAVFLFIALDFALILTLPRPYALPARAFAAAGFAVWLLAGRRVPAARLGLGFGDLGAGLRASGIVVALVAVLLALGAVLLFALRAAGVDVNLPDARPVSTSLVVEKALLTVVAYPLLEELVYRGFLHPPLEAACGRWRAILLSGLVFQALHLAYGLWWPHYLLGGALLAFAFARGRSLLFPVLLHALWNGFVLGVHVLRAQGHLPF